MYWEETIELIKEYANEPLASFPYPFADSDDLDNDPGYEVYEYERGTVKTKYIPIENFPEKIKITIERYFKYELYNLQLFCSLGASEGIGVHGDPDNVLITCLEGEISYIVEKCHGFTTSEDLYIKNDPVVLKAGDTIFIEEGLKHMGISSTTPRICLSCGIQEDIPKEEVTYYFGSRYRTKN